MAAITGAVIAAGATAYAANKQAGAAKAAGNASQRAADAAAAQQQQNYDRAATNLDPYISAGNSALTQMQTLNSGDYSSFTQSPDYQFALTQGLQGVDRSAAARGSLYSGGTTADTLKYAEGLASQNYDNYYNKLSGLSSQGLSASNSLSNVSTNTANQQSNLLTGNATSQANAGYNSANSNSNLVGQLAGIAGNYLGSRSAANQSSYGTGNVLSGGWNTGSYS